jgi:hypothetical protein
VLAEVKERVKRKRLKPPGKYVLNMAAAANVSFDVLLGGKVTPEAVTALKDMEEKLKQFGATTKTV